jgi:hypothetical protein
MAPTKDGSGTLKLFIRCRLPGLRDAHTEDSIVGHPVSTETKTARDNRPAGDIQEYDEVGHVWLDRTRLTNLSTHAQKS